MPSFDGKFSKVVNGSKINKTGDAPALISGFLAIRTNPEIYPQVEDFSYSFKGKKARKHIFEQAISAFDFVFDKKKFLKYLNQSQNEEAFKYFKQVRRCGLLIRDLYRFFDSSHQCPEEFNKFVILLGEYNDTYMTSPKEEVKEKIIASLEKFKFSMDFCKGSSFREHARDVLLEIDQLIKEKTLPVEKFHVLRRRIRSLASLVQPIAAENNGGKFHWLFFHLFKLSEKMGNHHDELITKGISGHIDYHNSMVELDPSIVVEIERLRPFVEEVFGINKD